MAVWHCVVDWWNAQGIESDFNMQMNVICLIFGVGGWVVGGWVGGLGLVEADISLHQWMCAVTEFEGCVWDQLVFGCVAMLFLVRQT